ncbi:MAG: hypothetical protein K0S46_902 [Moraxellaceae bacterium]|jgi:uncharacterized membrane protein YfcA|nr:hypothetical protein [Moraxellaceae bacterium]
MLALLIGAVIGLVLGLTGAGGSVLALPLLMQGLLLPPAVAAGVSLGAVALAAGFGVLLRRGRQVAWPAVTVLGIAGGVATPLGQWLGRQLPEAAVLAAFTLLVGVIARRMWRQAAEDPAATRVVRAGTGRSALLAAPACSLSESGYLEWRWPCMLRMGIVGLLAGVLSGLFGVGGGFVIVPALVLLTGLPMAQAVATSLAIIAVVAGAGFASFLVTRPDVVAGPALLVMAGGFAGMLAGTWLAPHLAGPRLQQVFVVAIVLLALWNLITTFA